MPVLIGVVCLIIALLGYQKTKYIFNPITSMFLMWALILSFSCWRLYETVIPSDQVYIIIVIGLVGYLIGTLLGMKKVQYSLGKFRIGRTNNYKINYPLLYMFGGIASVYYIFQITVVVTLLASGYTYEYIRALSIATDTNVLRSSATITMAKAFIATPMSYLSLALLPIELLKKNKNKVVLLGAIWLMLGYIITTGGRSVILWFALYFMAVFLMRKSKVNREEIRALLKKYRLIILVGGIALVYLLLKMTFARKGDDVDLLKQMYIYFVCPLQNFDYHLKVVDASNMYGYGLSSFYGLIYPILFILSKLRINVFTPYVEKIYAMSFQDLQMGYNIGGGIYMNAFVTAFYQPYLDGRYLGVFVVMIIFGFLSGRFFYNAYYKNNTKSLLIYILLLQKIIFSYVRFYFTQQAQSICFIIAFLVITKATERDPKNKIISF